MIKVLEKNIADKIAAGEVIERPISIVKELVENAIDAGAGSIVVEIKNGGKSYIRVTDDGCGIPEQEVETAFLRHATSKIETAEDLNAIDTLGFRGEALASIGAVSRTEILTKCRDQRIGTRVLFHGGEILSHQQTGCPDGTTLIVTDLFYNTPARLKFLKSDGAESGLIIDFLSQMALAYKDVRFRLINNGSVLFHTGGDGNRLNIIARVYKNVDPKLLTSVSYKEGKLRLNGYISTPAQSKTSRAGQVFFVNGRVVKSKIMEKGLMEGYRERLFEGRHPVAYLFLDTDPADLDVNIHPNKREVRFDREQEIVGFITRAIRAALGTKEAMVSGASLLKEKPFTYRTNPTEDHTGISGDNGEQNREVETQVDIKSLLSSISNDVRGVGAAKGSTPAENDVTSGANGANGTNDANGVMNMDTMKAPSPEAERVQEAASLDHIPASIRRIKLPKFDEPKSESPAAEVTSSTDDKPVRLSVAPPAMAPFDMDSLTILGCIFNTYIMATDETAFYLIDQHAAHERIFYEKLVNEYEREEKVRQPILIPLILNVSLTADEDRFNWLKALTRMGYTIDEFGQNTYRVTEIPTFMTMAEAEDFLHEFMDKAGESTDLKNRVVIDKLIMKSCKSAVKGGDNLSMAEIDALMTDLKQCVNPFSCPHGRPTFVRLTRYEIERLFKRIQS